MSEEIKLESPTSQPHGLAPAPLFAFVDALPPEGREAAEEVWISICEGTDLERSYKEAEAFERWGLINDLQMVDKHRYEFLWPDNLEGIAAECRRRRLARYEAEANGSDLARAGEDTAITNQQPTARCQQ